MSFLLLEDGSSKLLLEDGSSRLLLEDGAGGGVVVTSNLLLLGVGCVGWISLLLPTWYLTEGMQ
jgi:hypothetical protein